MAGGTKALEKVKGMHIRFAPLFQAAINFQTFALAYYYSEIVIYDARYLVQFTIAVLRFICS